MSRFQKASKKKAKLRAGLIGPSGSGKTLTALRIATHMLGGETLMRPDGRIEVTRPATERIAVIDTENGSASKYSDQLDFDVLELTSFSPQAYIDAIRDAAAEGFGLCIIDSLSHAWNGKGGALEQVDKAAKRSSSGNMFMAWRDVTPLHNAMVEAILRCPMHLVATLRAKTEYVMEEQTDRTGRKTTVPRRVGIQPVQRDGLEYEFDVIADLDVDNNFSVAKTRCSSLRGQVYKFAGKEVADILSAWLTDGAEVPAPEAKVQAPADSSPSVAGVDPRIEDYRSRAVSATTRDQLKGLYVEVKNSDVAKVDKDALLDSIKTMGAAMPSAA